MISIFKVCKKDVGAEVFFPSIFIWGIGVGCFAASLNNFLVDIHHVTGFQRGIVEFCRELPGVLLIILLAMMYRLTDWRVLRLGTIFSLLAAGLMLVPANLMGTTIFITLFSLGEHVVMPVRQAIALSIAKEGKGGESLGIVTGAINAGTVLGSLIVAGIFYALPKFLDVSSSQLMFDVVWCVIMVLLLISVVLTFHGKAADTKGNRPSFYFNKKYWRFYCLELFYGARKQVFLTFGPLLLIKNYEMKTEEIAMLLGVSALLTALFGGRLIGKLVDCWGYRNVMIYDTVILFFVCLLYGFADTLFAKHIAIWIVCINYILDTIISHASIASNLYAAKLSDTREELTATLSSGISVNHIISVVFALIGGIVFDKLGAEVLFSFAAAMSVANSLFAISIPKIIK